MSELIEGEAAGGCSESSWVNGGCLFGKDPCGLPLDLHLRAEGGARAEVDVGASSQVDSGSRSD